MLTKHIKIKQLNTINKKSTSNSDYLLVERDIEFKLNDATYFFSAITQFTEFLVQGTAYLKHNLTTKVTLETVTPHQFLTTLSDTDLELSKLPLDSIELQPTQLVDWVRKFKQNQPLYRQTGATESVGVLLDNGDVFTIECIAFETAFTKLIGALLKKTISFYPVLFVSHRINAQTAKLINQLNPSLIICQSAITDHALDIFLKANQTVYGFCRKNKFNRYSNFHL
ncbi:MAG: formate dehydrogenase accessory sulfurtransferase FdhD [Candidatus Margulisiibacteriota bacterium]